MAKTYAAELLLKNKGLIESLNKAVKKTKELKTELNNISKTPIKVEAKLGSSFKNVEANINRITPKSKTIKIEATENVTKTMNQVNRQMFEMSNKMNSTINTSMKGFASRLTASLPKLQSMSNTMAAIANTSSLMRAASVASGIGAAGAGLAGAALISRNRRGSSSENITDSQDPTGILSRIKATGTKIKDVAVSLGKKFSKGFKDAIENNVVKLKNGAIGNYINTAFSSKGIFASAGSGLAEMIEKQKAKLESLGMSNPLSKWKEQFITVGADEDIFEGFTRSFSSSFSIACKTVKTVFNSTINGLKTGFSSFVNGIKIPFNSAITGIKAGFNSIKTGLAPLINKVKQIAYSFKFACDRGVYFFNFFATSAGKKVVQLASNIKSKLSSAFSSLKSAASKIASAIPQPIKNALSKVGGFAKTAASTMYSAFKSATSKIGSSLVNGLSSAFNKVKSVASGVAKAVVAAFTAAVAVSVKDMATQEQYITSMTHFISVDDAKANGTNTITMDQAKERAEGLFDWGTDFANQTPFGNAEVYEAINRMTQVFGYGEDGSDIQKMVKLVGDMAALNPGKTMSDAAEAIADLAMGETERMKEFGLKLTQDDLKALAGVPGQTDTLSQEQIMDAFEALTSSGGALFETFDGGADALSQTMAGKWSTLIGQFRQMMVDAVKPFEGIIKDSLQKAIDFINGGFKTKFIGAFSTVLSFATDLMAGDSSNFPIIENLINAFNTLKDTITPIVDTVIEQYDKIFNSASESFGGMGGIIEGTANLIADILIGLAPILELAAPIFNTLKETAIAVWPVIQGVIDIASQIIKDCVEKLQPVFNAVDQVIKVIGETVADIWPKIQETILGVWEKLQPVLDLFGSLCQLIADIFSIAWPPIAGILETLWSIISPILEGIADVLGTISELATKAIEGISGAIEKAKESKLNPFNWFDSGDDSSQNAYGKDRIPYDGYKASLHEGERILTSRQATQMDAGLLGNGGSTNNTIYISVNGNGDPDITARLVVQRLKETLENTSVKSFA